MSAKLSKPKNRISAFPFLFALYPGLALTAHNLSEMDLSDSYRSVVISLLFTGLLLIALNFRLRNWVRSALVTTLLMLLFFSYGHVYDLLRETTLFSFPLFRHRVLAVLWAGLFVSGYWYLSHKIQHSNNLVPTLTIVALAALAVPAWNIVAYQSRAAEFEEVQSTGQEPASRPLSGDDDLDLPDIYYIILDGYSRDDYLLEYFDYDNSPFLTWLTEQGFYVAQCSQSNYAQTRLSLASSLNMDYTNAFYPSPKSLSSFSELYCTFNSCGKT